MSMTRPSRDLLTPQNFDTVADLLADRRLGYSGATKRHVSVGEIVEAGIFSYKVAAEGETDFDIEGQGGVKLDSLSDAYDPRAFGWTDGQELGSYIQAFLEGNWRHFYLPPGSTYIRATSISVDCSLLSDDKDFWLEGTVGTVTTVGGRTDLVGTVKGKTVPMITVHGGKTIFNGDWVAWLVQDLNQVFFDRHDGWGSADGLTDRGTLILVQNSASYVERFRAIGGKSKYLKHYVNFHVAGGGYSFKGAVVKDIEVSGGVAGEAIIANTTDVEVSLGINNATTYTVGETVTQTTTGATGRVIGYPESGNVLMLADIVGAFNTTNSVVGGASGQSNIPFGVVLNRRGNIYDGKIENIVGNINNGAYVVELGGSMRDTTIRGLSMEASVGAEAYYFKDENTWTDEGLGRPMIELPDLGGQMQYFSGARSKKSARARPILDGINLLASDVSPDVTEGTLAHADGVNWNPSNTGTDNGAKGLFARLYSGWSRVVLLITGTSANFSDVSADINTTKGKHLGMLAYDTTLKRYRAAEGASASSAWPLTSTPPAGSTANRPTNPGPWEQYTDTTIKKVIMWDPTGTPQWRDLNGGTP